MATQASNGYYLEPDGTPASGVLTVDADIFDGNTTTDARGVDWVQNNSYGIDVGSVKTIDYLIVYCKLMAGEPEQMDDWTANGGAFTVWGTDDDPTGTPTWTSLQSFSDPTIVGGPSNYNFTLTFSSLKTYRYFKVIATGTDGCKTVDTTVTEHMGRICEIEYNEEVGSPSESPSESPSLSPSASESPSESPSESASESPSESPSLSPSASESPSLSPSASESPSVSPSNPPQEIAAQDGTHIHVGEGLEPDGAIIITQDSKLPVGAGDVDFPDFTLEGYTGAGGEVDAPEFEIAATGEFGLIANGAVNFSDFTIAAKSGVYCEVDFSDFTIAATGMNHPFADGAATFPNFTIDATSLSLRAEGAINFPNIGILGTALTGLLSEGALLFPSPVVNAIGYSGLLADGAITHNFTIAATGYHGISADGAMTIDNIVIAATAHSGSQHDDTILKHQRSERFVT